MRVLYGVVGEGMGHATRSRVILDRLAAAGHAIRIVVSGRAHAFLRQAFADRPNVTIDEIHGLHFVYEGNRLDKSESLLSNLAQAPEGVRRNVAVYRRVAEQGFRPEVVLSDFESWAYLYAVNAGLPVISIDNIQMLNRCHHPEEVAGPDGLAKLLARLAVKVKMPGAYHYLITSFYFPPVRKPRTTLVPPILRPEILAARREPGAHVLVYQTASANQELVPTLQRLGCAFRVYGMGREGVEKNVTLKAFSPTGFVDDLRRARAVIAGGGYSLMGEAVHLRVPMLSVPVAEQYEQELNARYLEHLGYGARAAALDVEVIDRFLGQTDAYARALARYTPRDNQMVFGCLEELLGHVALDEPKPVRLAAASLGSYGGPLLPEEISGATLRAGGGEDR